MNNHIHELELNFSNACLANCIFCSRAHGCGNAPFMEPRTFDVLKRQLEDVQCDIIQTSGNGETFLNPHYLTYIRDLKKRFPHVPRWIYNNFSMMTPDKSIAIISEKLFDRVHVRIDSLHGWITKKNSNLNHNLVMGNLTRFLALNKDIPVVILYNDINVYYKRCQEVTGKRPDRDYYTDEELARVTDEMSDIEAHFKPLTEGPISFCKINPCLWGERRQAPVDKTYPCPKINVIKSVLWVLPNGDCTACCYDDEQDKFIIGNVHTEHILDIYNGEKRAEWIRKIENREITGYPCTNPRCCGFGDGMEAK